MLPALDRLRLFLRPPGRGLYSVSSGGSYAANLLKQLYGTDDPGEVERHWEDSLQLLRRKEVVILGVPSDTGAGIMRGANFGPIGIREAYLQRHKQYPKNVVDVGDVIVVPQLLHDEMLNASQIKATREKLYPGVAEALPVSPLSIVESALAALYELNPKLKPVVLGGDHSVAWPVVNHLSSTKKKFGILHLDAHTDMLESRLGVKICFGTWAFHAMKLLPPLHLVQVGIRASGKPKSHWVGQYPIVQHWAREIAGREDAVIAEILEHFTKLGVKEIYLSNDIDGTDMKSAPATGTPEPNGLEPAFVLRLIAAVRAKFAFIGSDVVEVAPVLSGGRDFAIESTCVLAAQYLHAQL